MIAARLIEWLCKPDFDDVDIVHVVSWRPWIYRWAIEWPCVRVRYKNGRVQQLTPVFDWTWFRVRFLGYTGSCDDPQAM